MMVFGLQVLRASRTGTGAVDSLSFLVFLPADNRVILLRVPVAVESCLWESHCVTGLRRSRQGQAPKDRGLQFTFIACLASGAWHGVSIPEALEKQKAATGKQRKQNQSVKRKGVYSASQPQKCSYSTSGTEGSLWKHIVSGADRVS